MSPTTAGALWMTGTIASFSLMAVAGRAAQAELDTFDIMFYRSAIGLAIVLAVGAITQPGRDLHQALGQQMLRNLFHFTGQNLWLYALAVAPLAQVFALEFSSPLWVALLAPLILAERLTLIRRLAVLMGFAGILIVARPFSEGLDPGAVMAVLAAICFAATAIITKLLTRRIPIISIMFWMTLIQMTYGLIAAAWDGAVGVPSPRIWPSVVVVGLTGITAHFCLTRALSLAPATLVMPIDFLRLPLIAIVGFLVYGESIGAPVLLGGGVILLANWLNLRASRSGR